MTFTPPVEAPSLLAVDAGSINTRALLFDTVEGRYRFLAAGLASSTAGAPLHDISEGVHSALDQLHEITGRTLVGEDERLLTPSAPGGAGVDLVAATLSAGPPLKVVALGLLDKVSLESVRRLVSSTYVQIIETLSLNDQRKAEAHIDTILQRRPDLVVIAGGTDEGATRSVLKLVNMLGMALHLLPEGLRPDVLFIGNQMLVENVTNFLEPLARVYVAPNIRPTLETERLGPAEAKLNELFRKIQAERMLGVNELDAWSGGHLLPTSAAFGRVVRFLSKVYDPHKGVLGVDLGASSTVIAAGFAGDLMLNVYPHLGVGEGLQGLVKAARLEEIARWIPLEVPDQYVLDYLYNKPLHPGSLPATPEDLAIEQAAAREAIRQALHRAGGSFPDDASRPAADGTLPWFDPILVSGSAIASAPDLAQSLLMVLDALEPTGLTRVILDQNALAPALGAAAALNSVLSVQVLESNSFVHLGNVIAPVGRARWGTPALRLRIEYDTGQENTFEINVGSLQRIPLPAGRTARVHLQPLQRFDVGMGGPGKSGWVSRVVGGAFGLVVDARGRPLELPSQPEQRRDLLKKWHFALQR